MQPAALPSPEELALLPVFERLPLHRIALVATQAQAEAAAAELEQHAVWGFDTESKPTFAAGEASQGPHTVQLASLERAPTLPASRGSLPPEGAVPPWGGPAPANVAPTLPASRGSLPPEGAVPPWGGPAPGRAFVFQLHDAGCRERLAALLAREGHVKVGFGLQDDRRRIGHKLGVELRDVLDLDTVLRQRGWRRQMGVKMAVAVLFGQRFVKSRRLTTSNWGSRTLSDPQLLYAANDAWAALCVHQALGSPRGHR